MTNQNYRKAAFFIESRFLDLMLSQDFALKRLGLKGNDDSRVSATPTVKLDVEYQAREEKQKREQAQQEFRVYVNEYFHEFLFEYLDEKMVDKDYIFSELFQYEGDVIKLFDCCVAKAAGVTQFEHLITNLVWLKQRFLHLVNNPPFREKDSTKPTLEKIGLAIRYIGVDNTKTALIAQIARNWLPHSTEPFGDFKNNYWRYTLATANCMRALAEKYKVNEHAAFILGFIHAIGMSIVIRAYLRAFNVVLVEQIKIAGETDRRDIEQVLNTLEIDPEFLHEALRKYANKMTEMVLSRFDAKYAVMAPFIEELNNNIAFEDAAPMTQMLVQAKTYCQYKILQKARLIEIDEAKTFLTYGGISNDVINILNQVDLNKIKFSL